MAKAGRIALAILGVAALVGVWHFVFRHHVTVLPGVPAALPIDRETTYLTGPLGPDGRVDYAAALNATALPPPEENAALSILEILGTDALVREQTQILAALGMTEGLTAEGILETYSDELPYFDAGEDLESEEERAAVRSWLRRNRPALDGLLKASHRPRLAWPVVRDPSTGLFELALGYGAWESLISTLQKRATLHLVDGKPPSGWSDIQAELRLATLVGQQAILLPRLFEMSLRSHALEWVGRALAAGALDRPAWAEVRRTLEALPPPRGLDREVIEQARLVLLDCYIREVADRIRSQGCDPAWHPANVALAAALREINLQFDAVAKAIRPTAAESLAPLSAEIDRLRESVNAIGEELQGPTGRLKHLLDGLTNDAHQGTLIGKVLASVALAIVPGIARRSVRVESHRYLVSLALALKMYELRTGAFPVRLEDLGVDILPEGSLDLTAVSYERDETGCRLEHGEEEIEIAAGKR